ncbi:uncharacterized protein DUF1861 [Paenibacillus taihuensis]|uniref:Uncharacterized protein DUF1861 n=1 Tax=Paenibacillus taihuensis TaxID=1156355 RepID=A0A3D9RQC9_9BACL|nr:DUF1861 family protein [Paenibacillus taihuensis]REE78655.1 uncharacterized protein DUF1861 [Paenibacillus taihuensis]
MITFTTAQQTTKALLTSRAPSGGNGERIVFDGVQGRDVYNISAPFQDNGEWIIAGRVEGRQTELSEVLFFRRAEASDVWTPHPELTAFKLQDPFMTHIAGELVFGGVEVITDPANPEHIVSWVTRFYRGRSIASLRPFVTGPDRMKDIRLVELTEGAVGVLTRPQGEVGGRGKIGFIKADSLDAVTADLFEQAHIFRDQFIDEEWGGANEAHLLANGLIGVLGHIASFDEAGNRHYYSMTFAIQPGTLAKTPMKIIAARNDFPAGPAKRDDLVDVIFSGGIRRQRGGVAELYVGASDAEAYRTTIPDPFEEYEKL